MDALYQDADLVRLYDALNRDRADFAFYRTRLPSPPARLLDVGCGTGQFALDLAEAGYEVTAVDPAPAMIAAARAKPGSHRVRWIVGDLSAVPEVPACQAATMTGHALQCLLTDANILGLFRHMAARLVPGGVFLTETRNPAARAWESWSPAQAKAPVALGDGRTVAVVHDVEQVDGDRVTFRETYRFSDGTPDRISRSTLRFADHRRLTALAAKAGLTVADLWGDWSGTAFDPDRSPEIILKLCR